MRAAAHACTVLVTGANRGLGLEVCRQLARKGFRVILTSRRDDDDAPADPVVRTKRAWRKLNGLAAAAVARSDG